MVRLRSECRFRAEPLTDLVQVIREELLPEKYIEVKKSIRGDPTKAESFPIYAPLSWIHESYCPGKVRNSNTPIGMSRTSLRQPPNMLLACVQCPRSIGRCGNRICLDRAFHSPMRVRRLWLNFAREITRGGRVIQQRCIVEEGNKCSD